MTQLLAAHRAGDENAMERLLPLVYAELRRVAASHLRRERDWHTLQPTALVHEAYLRMVEGDEAPWQDRAHFVGFAAHVMRNVLVDHARKRRSAKRGGGWTRVTLDAAGDVAEGAAIDRWRRIQDLFARALDRATDEREAWLAAQCVDDAETKDEVEKLLRAHEHGRGFSSRM